MNPHIFKLCCVNPKASFSQRDIANTFDQSLNLKPNISKKLQLIFSNSEINTRCSIISDYKNHSLKGNFFGDQFPEVIPDTFKRNQIYIEEAPKLSKKVCEEVLEKWEQSRDKITHIISVSCTGMYAPGIEFGLIESLGLNENVQRLGINFMGCFGAFKGLAIAKALAKENPLNRILLVCTELCSLHFQTDQTIETFVANALFADGASAAIIGCNPIETEKTLFEIETSTSHALKDSQDMMSWEIGNNGMLMKLSSKVPKLIEQHIGSFVSQLIEERSFDSCEWAIHPGGKAILKAIEKACCLNEEQTRASWKTLKNFGNMSSATFLFVLDEISRKKNHFKQVIGLGFGPGLSIEGILLRKTHV